VRLGLFLRFRNNIFLRGEVVSLTLNPQPGGPGYPFLSGSSPLTCLAWEALPVAFATTSIALGIIWPHKPRHYAKVWIPSGVYIYTRGDRRTDMLKLIIIFLNFLKAPKSMSSSQTLQHFSTWPTLRATHSSSRYKAQTDEYNFLVIRGCSINWAPGRVKQNIGNASELYFWNHRFL
jgi:hypothetical protein